MADRVFTKLAAVDEPRRQGLDARRSSTAARPRRVRMTSSSRGNCSRARSRRPAASRFRRCTPSPSGCSGSFRSRPTCPAHFKVLDESELKRLLREARDAALAELSASSDSAGALDLVARELGAPRFDELLTEALSRAETFAAHDDALAYAAALERSARSCARRDGRERRGGDARRRRRAHAAREMGATPRGRQEAGPENCREPSRGECEDRAGQARVQALLDGVFQGRRRASRRREWPADDQSHGPESSRRSRTTCVASRIACSSCASAGAQR